MSPRMGRTGGAAARGFGKGTAVRGPRGIPSVVSATAVGTVENASNGKLNLTWTNTDATSQTRIYNGGTLLATENAGTTTKSLTTLNANTAYTLTVKHYKDSIESAGANFSQATTYQYNGSVNSTSCAGANSLDLYSNVANGNNGTAEQLTSAGYYTCVTNYNISATGGTTSDANGWRTHEFNSSDTFAISSCDANAVVQVILAAGGGGSQNQYNWARGGGGGGSLEYNYATSVNNGNYTITVGAGGGANANGANTTGFGTTAYGGGKSNTAGGSAGGSNSDHTGAEVAAGSGNNVNAGGWSGGDRTAGGGGGAGGVGVVCNGGSALAIGFSPYSLCGGGGGGAAWNYDTWIGGSGGSGAGSGGGCSPPEDAQPNPYGFYPNTGGPIYFSTSGTATRGGGAGGVINAWDGDSTKSGGSGIALIRYRIS